MESKSGAKHVWLLFAMLVLFSVAVCLQVMLSYGK